MKIKSRKIPINGLQLQCYFWGRPKNPPIFLFHGWLDTGAGFHFLCEQLADRFYCIAPDMRGYGKSGHTRSSLGYFFFEYVADLQSILQFFSPRKKAILLGHSLGGAVASVYAGTFPERVSHFINIEGFAFQRKELQSPPARARKWLEGLPVKDFILYPDEKLFVARLKKTYPRIPEGRLRFLSKYLGRRERKGYRMAADPKHKLLEPYAFSVETFYQFWREIRARCLFISAAETEMADFFLEGSYARELARQRKHFPKKCLTELIAGTGHMVHYEKPSELAVLIRKFLGRTG